MKSYTFIQYVEFMNQLNDGEHTSVYKSMKSFLDKVIASSFQSDFLTVDNDNLLRLDFIAETKMFKMHKLEWFDLIEMSVRIHRFLETWIDDMGQSTFNVTPSTCEQLIEVFKQGNRPFPKNIQVKIR